MSAIALSLAAISASAAQARWSGAHQLVAPGSSDFLPSQLALSSGGTAAAAFGTDDVDTPGSSQADVVTQAPNGTISGPLTIAGASQVLALDYDGGSLELLTGSSRAGVDCCSAAQIVRVTGGRASGARTLVGGLTGTAQGRLLTLAGGQMVAVVATERGVWTLQSSRSDRFGAKHLLSRAGQIPTAVSAAWLGGQRSVVVWTAGNGPAGQNDARALYAAYGSRTRAPGGATTALTIPAGHRIDELGVAPRAGGATVAWVESWSDPSGGYHSIVRALDLTKGATPRTLSASGVLAAGLTIAGDQAGDQAVSFQSCTFSVVCSAQLALRPAKGTFRGTRSLGPIDPSQFPALAVGPSGQVLVGLVRGGRPMASLTARPTRSPGAPSALSSSIYAGELAVAYGAGGRALVAWTQGTLNPSLVATSAILR